jgi:hypothetical protein
MSNKTFLGLIIDTSLSWCTHIEQLIPRLDKTFPVIRFLKLLLSLETLGILYYSIDHSFMS